MPVRPKAMLRPSLASTLPEELVDLVCWFVLEFSDEGEHQTVKTLCSLCLTARCFLPSAHRALFDDPTRALALRDWESSQAFLRTLLKRPELGRAVKHLDRLVDVHDSRVSDYEDLDESCTFEVWCLSLLRLCPNIESLAIYPYAPEVDWPSELAKLPRLSSLAIRPRRFGDGEPYEIDLDKYYDTLLAIDLNRFTSLRLDGIDEMAPPPRRVTIPTPHLSLGPRYLDIPLTYEDLLLDIESVRVIVIEPCDELEGLATWLPATVESLAYRPTWSRARARDFDCDRYPQLCYPLVGHAHFSALKTVVLEFVVFTFEYFADLVDKAPNLEIIDLTDSAWHSCEWHEGPREAETRLCGILNRLPHLKRLRLGFLALRARFGTMRQTYGYCRKRGIEFHWRPTMGPEPSEPLGEAEDAAQTVEESVGPDGAVPALVADHRFPLAIVWRDDMGVSGSKADEDDALDPFGHEMTVSEPPTPPMFDYEAERDAWEARALALAEVPRAPDVVLPYERASSASPDPSADIPPGEGRDYLSSPPASQRRFEPGYEALDLVDEEDDEPWLEWQDRADIAEADRQWREWSGPQGKGIDWNVEADWGGSNVCIQAC
ncbi:hypothetical protein Rhopal_001584-T1 [Rhodotorula paludigena]|uniref:Proteophosphoglycan ppg4 n=1 Tax=Rhodotorula paludigena TaxID=86838 RepID=A0AAV5GER8_9BASI|nr:hypothetical protein Rhopal_001584-T1 [Rhodotorula paludigena]